MSDMMIFEVFGAMCFFGALFYLLKGYLAIKRMIEEREKFYHDTRKYVRIEFEMINKRLTALENKNNQE